MKNPPFHHFPVFSVIDDNDQVQMKHAQCNNCGVIHRVIDICRSEIMHGKEAYAAIPRIDEIKMSLSSNLQTILDGSNVDISVYENAKFIVDNKRWGEFVILSKETEGSLRTVKYLQIMGENIIRVEMINTQEDF